MVTRARRDQRAAPMKGWTLPVPCGYGAGGAGGFPRSSTARAAAKGTAKSMLRGAGVLELIGERWFVAESRLRERLPDVYDRVYEAFVLDGGAS
jgi:hypothetical protein